MKKLLVICALPLALTFSSCKKNPVACFTADKTSVEIAETVTFESCATDANIIEWDFGDGATAEGESATHAWTIPGTYVVQMKVLSKNDKKSDRYSVAITVKGYTRYLTKAVLKAFPANKPDNSTWDGSSFGSSPEPDVLIRFRLANDSNWEYNSSVKSNIQASDLPYTWNLTQQNIYLSNQSWTIELRDDDSFGTNLASELMNSWTVNPATSGSDGIITLTATGYALDLYFENRQ
jgi:PKD repeat protein